MTTLSTLIGSTGAPLGLGDVSTLHAAASAKASLWQRLGGVFRPQKARPARRSGGAAAEIESPADDADAVTSPVEALRSVVDDTVDGFARRALTAHAFHAYAAREASADDRDDDGRGPDGVDRTDAGYRGDTGYRSDAGFGSGPPSLLPPTPPRRRSLWGGTARRDAAMDEVRHGMGALASLLAGIQQNMEQQGARQQELIACLSHLPLSAATQGEALAGLRDGLAGGSAALVGAVGSQTEVLAAIRDGLAAADARAAEAEARAAESALAQQSALAAQQDVLAAQHAALLAIGDRVAEGAATQNQSLVAIRDQIERSATTQVRLSDALDRLGGIQETTGAALTSISRRIDQMDARDTAFVASLERVSDAMQTVSRASEASAGVLDRVQVGLADREDGVRRTLDKHQTKFNALMAVAIAVSTAALAVVAGVGYLVLTKIH
jgi:hypothetical protein